MKRLFAGFFVAILLAASASVAGATTIDTSSSPVINAYSFGEYYGWSTIGQTFNLNPGDDTTLDSVTFYVNDYSDPNTGWSGFDNIDFAFHLYAWDGGSITGASLFTSGQLSTAVADVSGYETFTVNTGGVSLSTGTDYVFFVSTLNYYDGWWSFGKIGLISDSSYAGGTLVITDSTNLVGTWPVPNSYDMPFVMQLSPSPSQVPEPSTLLLLGGGLAGLGIVRRFRKG
ncbi:MAG: PEP-CTERM sorting domain-containing protein [Deltaproteobacteria bacterium]|nr:PEP-CTERM sorting domain-containing protein [Deltaproteobacteria bacterium]